MRALGVLMLLVAAAAEAYVLTRPVLSGAQQITIVVAAGVAVWGMALAFGADVFERALGPVNQDELGPAFELTTSREDGQQ